jgi:hypothetical protein
VENESVVGNYKLEKKYLLLFFPRRRNMQRFSLVYTIRNGKQFPQYWKNDPKRGGKLL